MTKLEHFLAGDLDAVLVGTEYDQLGKSELHIKTIVDAKRNAAKVEAMKEVVSSLIADMKVAVKWFKAPEWDDGPPNYIDGEMKQRIVAAEKLLGEV